ncbi:MAG TPA: ATP-binding protein [Ignavibacteriales bacterium]|nr:ATP-binding protein [Ignavibacteriales bacterium]
MQNFTLNSDLVNLILNSISSAIVITNENLEILFHNNVAGDLLNCKNSSDLSNILSTNDLVEKVNKLISHNDVTYEVFTSNITTLNNDSLICNVKFIKISNFYLLVIDDKTHLTQLINDLKNAKEAEEQAKKAQIDFLSNLSHEIRTPMNGVIGMTDLLAETNLDEEQLEYVNLIKKSSKSLMMLLNSLFDISKYEKDEIELNNEVFDFIELVESAVKSVDNLIKTKNLKFNYQIDKNIPEFLYGDFNKLKQLLSNLLHNAVKFTEQGYISLQVKEEATRFNSSNEKNHKILFIVADSGIGIKDEIKDKIYDRFSQGDTVMFKNYSGVGLGLTIVKQIVNLMKGEIWFESQVGKGTTFYVAIELTEKNSQTKNDDFTRIFSNINNDAHVELLEDLNINSKVTENQKNNLILIVDDNKLNQQVISNIFDKYGVKYKIMNNGLEAINELRTNKYDLVFMDMMMPVMDGIETTKIIRNGQYPEIDKNIKIIALTAFTQKEIENRYQDLQIDGLLSKPFHKNDILKLLKQHLPFVDIKNYELNESVDNEEEFAIEEVLDRIGNDKNLLKMIYQTFTQDIFKYIFSLNEALEKGDYHGAKVALHTMKSLTSNIGANRLTKVILNLEVLIEEKSYNRVNEFMNNLRIEIKNFLKVAETKIKEISGE